MTSLVEVLRAAMHARAELLARLHDHRTDCYRLLHGISEGAPGLSVDRYGSLLLLQTWREALAPAEVDALADAAQQALGGELHVVCNHRGAEPPPDFVAHQPTAAALAPHIATEHGVRFVIEARHRGQDPWLFLDLRAGRRVVRDLAAGKRVLNLFAYTCGVGVAAACGGASRVVNVDFAASALDVGARNAAQNGVAERCTQLHADCLPVLRQVAGLTVQRRGKHVPFAKVAREAFDVIVLDPPRFAKTAFGTIDVVNDYQSLFKPALLALAPGGVVLATNHVPNVAAETWHELLRRCAAKAGRPLRSLDAVPVDGDFPSFDGRPPLKLALATI